MPRQAFPPYGRGLGWGLKIMKTLKSILLAIAMLLAAPAFLTSCQEDAPEINYTMNVSVINDFTKVVEAINNGSLKNEQAIQKLTEAIDKMNADQQTKLQAITDVLNSVNATLETKLTAIEAAMKAQTLTLESKLALLETAIKNQTIKQEEMAQKLVTAIDNLSSSMVAKIEAITAAINSQSTALQSKLALIEAAMKAQTLTLESKLDLIEKAIKALPDYSVQLEAIKAVIESLPDYGGKLDLIEKAIKALPDYSVQLEAIKAVIESLPDYGGKLDALANAIKALPDNSAQLEAIKTAIEALPNYGDKLTALENAIKALPNYSDKFDAVVAALNAMKTQIEALGTGQTAIATQIGEVTAAINNLIASVNSGNTSAAAALAQIIAKLEELKTAIGSGSTGGGTGGTVTPGGGGETPSTEDYVDLGLPSGIKWATKNLGASKPSDYGDYYAWGETEPKANYSWETYKWVMKDNLTKYNDTDGKTSLDPADDAATAKLGSSWRIPTSAEIAELLNPDNCTWTWITQDDVNGYEVKSKKNGNSIFLPAAGARMGSELIEAGSFSGYWSGSLGAADTAADTPGARGLLFGGGDLGWDSLDRFCGFSVRPVCP